MVNKKMLELGRTRSVIRELFEYGKQLKAERGEDKVFDFSLGNPNVTPPKCVTEAIKKHLADADVHNYTSAQGDLGVRKRIAEYNNEKWNVGLTENDIYVTTGAAAALVIAFTAINDGEREFIALAPFFPEYKVFVESAGGKLVTVQTAEDFSIDVSAVEKAITKNTKAIIINSPNNPVGSVYSESQIIELSRVLDAKQKEYGTDIYLISDEPYREITYGKDVPNPMRYFDNTIICYSFSKTLSLAGERIGYIAISPKCRERAEIYAAVCGAGRELGYVCAPSLFQKVSADCLGQTADINEYKLRRDLLCEIMDGCGFEYAKPDGAFYLFVKCPIEPKRFFEICKKHGVLVVPSESFGTPGYVRIAYCVSTQTIVGSKPYFELIAKECGM